jgi:hypothetical protein
MLEDKPHGGFAAFLLIAGPPFAVALSITPNDSPAPPHKVRRAKGKAAFAPSPWRCAEHGRYAGRPRTTQTPPQWPGNVSKAGTGRGCDKTRLYDLIPAITNIH